MDGPSAPRRNPDAAYRRLFTHRDLMADMIQLYVNPQLEGRLDPTTLERCNGTYVSADLRERRSDLVWRIRATDERWFYVYLLLEFQSRVDRFMAVRLLGYIALLWQDLIAQKQVLPDGHLPPVLPLVLHIGSTPWTAPHTMTELIAVPLSGLAPMQPSFTYLLLDENRLPTEAGVAACNIVAAIFALQQCQSVAAQEHLIGLLREWLRERQDIDEEIASWYVEAIAPYRLPAPLADHIITLAEVETMGRTEVLRNIKLQVDREVKLQVDREVKLQVDREVKLQVDREVKLQVDREVAVKSAEAKVEMILRLMRSGNLTIEQSRAEVTSLLNEQAITAELARSTLDQLG
jgi:hypothetical protein